MITRISILSLLVCISSQGLDLSPDVDHSPFWYGVASGDPLTDAVLIWTRVESTGPDVTLQWSLWNALGFRTGFAQATANTDWTVMVEVTGLSPDTPYLYQFQVVNSSNASVTGRTRTLPLETSDVEVPFAVVSCSSMWSGYFNAYSNIADNPNIHYVIHLGDYIYPDTASSGVECIRIPPGLCSTGFYSKFQHWTMCPDPTAPSGPEAFHMDRINCSSTRYTLTHNRWVHALYLLDPNLRRARQNFPWFTIYDNHDDEETDGSLNGQLQAFFEYVPHRHRITNGTNVTVQSWRNFKMGRNVDLIVLDLRSAALKTDDFVGPEQWQWLQGVMNDSHQRQTPWRVIASSVQFTPVSINSLTVVNEVMAIILAIALALSCMCCCTLWHCRPRARQVQTEAMELMDMKHEGSEGVTRASFRRIVRAAPPIKSGIEGLCRDRCPKCHEVCCVRTPAFCRRSCCCSIARKMWCSFPEELANAQFVFEDESCAKECCKRPCCCGCCRGWLRCSTITVLVIALIWGVLIAALGNPRIQYLNPSKRVWDGNLDSRVQFLELLASQTARNNVWIAGDMHYSLVSDVFLFDVNNSGTLRSYDNASRFGIEFMPPSVSRGNLDEIVADRLGGSPQGGFNSWVAGIAETVIRHMNPQMRYFDGSRHGYGLLKLSPSEAQCEMHYISILEKTKTEDEGYNTILPITTP